MTTNRTSRNAWVRPSKLPRGPNDRPCCRQCGTEVPKGRRTFCSQACVDEWRIRSDQGYARSLVFRRDKGVCQLCGLATEPLSTGRKKQYFPSLEGPVYNRPWYRPWWDDADDPARNVTVHIMEHEHRRRRIAFEAMEDRRLHELLSTLKALGFTTLRNSLWEMDHIVPVVEGGGECGLDNLRTLCQPCHRQVTADLAARRAEQRRAEKEAALEAERSDLSRLPLFGGLERERAQPA